MLEKIDTMPCPICTAIMEKKGGNGYGTYKKKFRCSSCKITNTIEYVGSKDYRQENRRKKC